MARRRMGPRIQTGCETGAVSWLSQGRSCLEAKAEEWCCGQSGRGTGGLRVPL